MFERVSRSKNRVASDPDRFSWECLLQRIHDWSHFLWFSDFRALEAKREVNSASHFIETSSWLYRAASRGLTRYPWLSIPRVSAEMQRRERKGTGLEGWHETHTTKEARWSRKTSDMFSLNTPDRTNAGQLKPVSIYTSRHSADRDSTRALSNYFATETDMPTAKRRAAVSDCSSWSGWR